ncbi:MAG: helix-turn-helix domain-containing protein [Chitinivibrionales bacterium]|nr:helix-turn-helix domain-containing protein [Chitinivibrionales bacterium]
MKTKTEQIQPRFGKPIRHVSYPVSDNFAVSFRDNYLLSDRPDLRMQFHELFEIGYCTHGHGVFIAGNRFYQFSSGDMAVIPPNVLHLAQSSPGWKSTWSFLFFDPVAVLGPFTDDYSLLDTSVFTHPGFPCLFNRDRSHTICFLAREMVDELRARRAGYRNAVRSLMLVLLTKLHRQPGARSNAPVSTDNDVLKRIIPALELIASGYAGDLRIAALAEACCMSVRNFNRQFKEALKKTPWEYLNYYRISMACAELRATSKPVRIIAYSNGFTTLSSFNRSFKAIMKMSPREWRKGAGNNFPAGVVSHNINTVRKADRS